MNRGMRRNLIKNGAKKETVDRLTQFDSPCTIREAMNLSRAIAQDVASEFLDDYNKRNSGVVMAIALQLEILKDTLFKAGILTEEEFNEMYEKSAKELEQQQQAMRESMKKSAEEKSDEPKANVSFETSVGDVEVNKLK